MQTPKKRKAKNQNQNNEDDDDSHSETFSSPPKRPHSGHKGAWTDEETLFLKHSIISAQCGNDHARVPWGTVYAQFQEAFPDVDRTLKSLQMHYQKHIQNGDIDLTEEEIDMFKKAIANIDGPERMAAIAWQFEKLGGKALNKNATSKLYKQYH